MLWGLLTLHQLPGLETIFQAWLSLTWLSYRHLGGSFKTPRGGRGESTLTSNQLKGCSPERGSGRRPRPCPDPLPPGSSRLVSLLLPSFSEPPNWTPFLALATQTWPFLHHDVPRPSTRAHLLWNLCLLLSYHHCWTGQSNYINFEIVYVFCGLFLSPFLQQLNISIVCQYL